MNILLAFALTLHSIAYEFPIDYQASLVYSVPFGGVSVPIYFHHMGSARKQLIQYYDGLAKELLSVSENLSYKDVYNVSDRICLSERSEEPVALINIFPDLSQFNYSGLAVTRGLQCDHWTKQVERPGEEQHFYFDPKLNVPVRWTMHSRDDMFDSHMDDYIIDYISLIPLDSSATENQIRMPPICEDPKKRKSLEQTGKSSSHLLRSPRNLPSMGYIPRKERESIQVFGDSLSTRDILETSIPLPPAFDWREKGGSPVPKDQAMCGSCYAFAVVGAIESQYMIRNGGVHLPLSEQFLLDCGWSAGSSSCSGGNQEELGPLLLEKFNGFVPFEEDYGGYMSTYSYCKNTTGMGGIHFHGWVNLPARSSTDLIKKSLVQNGILSVSINAIDPIVFHRKGNGVIRAEECRNTKSKHLNHAVNLVGWKDDFWILRNSWSTNWGDDGYFMVEIGERDCGVSVDVSFPIIKKAAGKVNDHVVIA